jgi:hypothetical protein
MADSLFYQVKPADSWNKVTVDIPIPEEPVLGALIATENGTYNNLVGYTEEPPVIAIGETVEFKEIINGKILPTNNGYSGFYSDENATRISMRNILDDERYDIHITYTINNDSMYRAEFEYFGPKEASRYSYLEGPGWYYILNGEKKKITTPPPLTILTIEPINHSFFDTRSLPEIATIFKGSLKPVDGWNQVIIHVPTCKPAVLTGLTITENGFYEKTLVENPSLACGETLTFKDIINEEDIPIEFFDKSRFTFYDDGRYFCSSRYDADGFEIIVEDSFLPGSITAYISDKLIKEHPDWYPDCDSAGWYIGSYGADSCEKTTPPTLTIGQDLPDSMRYGYLSKMIKCFVGTDNQVAADGYHSVYVNVPKDIIEVEELPVENIDTTKIYKTVVDGKEVFGIPSDATIKRLVDGVWVEL